MTSRQARRAAPARRRALAWLLMLAAATGLPGAQAQAGDLVELVARSKPAVLPVGTYAETDNPRFSFRGTGFAVDDGRWVITNAHVLPEAMTQESSRRLAVQLRRPGRAGEWEIRGVQVHALDRVHDLALLRLDGAPAPASLKLAPTGSAREGAAVALLGFPLGGALGLSTVTHRGIVSAITAVALPPPSAGNLNERTVSQLREGSFDILQLDATAYPGNSGGPVLDAASGEVIGIVNMVLVRGSREGALSRPSGISYAIPVQHAAALLDRR